MAGYDWERCGIADCLWEKCKRLSGVKFEDLSPKIRKRKAKAKQMNCTHFFHSLDCAGK